MKKISMLLASLLAVCSLGACAEKEETAFFVNDFEKYDEIRLVRMERCIGSMKVCEDEKYVTSGDGCLQFNVVKPSALAANGWITGTFDTGEDSKNITPNLGFSATSPYDKLNEVSEFTFDVYNDTGKDCKILFTAITSVLGEWAAEETVVFSYIVDATNGQMNRLRVPVSPLFHSKELKIAQYNMAFYGVDSGSIYLDNFVAHKEARQEISVSDRKEGIILDFDNAEEIRYLDYATATLCPTVAFRQNTDYAYAQNGYSLKLDVLGIDGNEHVKTSAGDKQTKSGNGVTVAKEVLEKCNMSLARKVLIDGYVDSENAKTLVITASDGTNEETLRYDVAGGAWTTLSYYSSKVDVTKLTKLEIKVDTTAIEEEFSVYLDDLRYE